ncbi:phosphoglycerate mutase-like protein [Zalerion maritima]|uniref:Phosphoglycerate mutase-like protein n=1 Tax=Zalerion maritima TaxID=339359 RepID=A0AAD5RYJ8_9PEZI|nr:phosphoglycerate mutase-like protein [Zalerion maritima]
MVGSDKPTLLPSPGRRVSYVGTSQILGYLPLSQNFQHLLASPNIPKGLPAHQHSLLDLFSNRTNRPSKQSSKLKEIGLVAMGVAQDVGPQLDPLLAPEVVLTDVYKKAVVPRWHGGHRGEGPGHLADIPPVSESTTEKNHLIQASDESCNGGSITMENSPEPQQGVSLFLYRHAQGIHNLSIDPTGSHIPNAVRWLLYNVNGDLIPDPVLTVKGINWCDTQRAGVSSERKKTLKNCVFAISPYKRNLQTLLLQFADVLANAKFKYIVVDPSLQEPNGAPCNLGSTTKALREFFQECLNFGGLDRDTKSITDATLKDAWLGAGFKEDVLEENEDDGKSQRQDKLMKIWVENGWVTQEMLKGQGQGIFAGEGKSFLGEAILLREFRRRLKNHAGLANLQLLIVGEDITQDQWVGKDKMEYGRDAMKFFAPYPDLCRERFRKAKRNMGQQWRSEWEKWQAQSQKFTGFAANAGVVAIIHAGLVPALPMEWGMFRLPLSLKQTTSRHLLGHFKANKGKWYTLPRLTARKPYGYWQYSRGDAYEGESIIGVLQPPKTNTEDWGIVEDESSKNYRLAQHRSKRIDDEKGDEKSFGWLDPEDNALFDRYVLPVFWAACSVVAKHVENILVKSNATLEVKIGGMSAGGSPENWEWKVCDHKIDYTVGCPDPNNPSVYDLKQK